MPDSNRSPLTESHQFASSFGALGKANAPTIEKVSVVAKRPESVPAAATAVTGPKPIDAYYASFGTAIERAAARAKVDYKVLEKIIGTDDRVRVTNNTAYPWRCICSLLITANTGAQYVGTGWLVAPRLVLTAGHCVFMSDEGGWATQIEVIPGRNAAERPFGSAISRDLRSVTGWTQDNDSDYDYGAILLPEDKRFGEQLGWFGYASRDDDHLKSITLNLAGYPGDGGKTGIDGTQWYHSRMVMDVLEKQLTYDIDTFGGQSGAPVWELASNGSRYGVAIHTFGTPVNNGGTRITGDVFDNIVLWAGQAP
jgi:V8-like Glu-specific endopeptidase